MLNPASDLAVLLKRLEAMHKDQLADKEFIEALMVGQATLLKLCTSMREELHSLYTTVRIRC